MLGGSERLYPAPKADERHSPLRQSHHNSPISSRKAVLGSDGSDGSDGSCNVKMCRRCSAAVGLFCHLASKESLTSGLRGEMGDGDGGRAYRDAP